MGYLEECKQWASDAHNQGCKYEIAALERIQELESACEKLSNDYVEVVGRNQELESAIRDAADCLLTLSMHDGDYAKHQYRELMSVLTEDKE